MLSRLRAYFLKRSLDKPTVKKLKRLEEVLEIKITNPQLYLKALRHRSTLIEKNLDESESYEQLEFIGDAVLDLIISELIYEHFPKRNEGFMTKLRSKLVKEETLAKLALDLDVSALIEVGNRVRSQGIELKKSILCDIFEALTGALYFDKGLAEARLFVRRVYTTHIDLQQMSSMQDNFKSILLEYTQANRYSIPEYLVVDEDGPDHDKTFQIEVLVNAKVCGRGKGKNKKRAEQAAAMQALKHFKMNV